MARKRIDGNKNTPHLAPWILLLVLLTRLQEHLSQKAMQNLEEKKGIEGLKGLQVVEKWRRRRRETKETEEREGEREREREREKGSREQEKRPEAQTCTLGLCVAMAGRQKREREREGGSERERALAGSLRQCAIVGKSAVHPWRRRRIILLYFYLFFIWFAFAGSLGKWICKMILILGPTKDRIEMATNKEDPL
jgi:hypothetical protein